MCQNVDRGWPSRSVLRLSRRSPNGPYTFLWRHASGRWGKIKHTNHLNQSKSGHCQYCWERSEQYSEFNQLVKVLRSASRTRAQRPLHANSIDPMWTLRPQPISNLRELCGFDLWLIRLDPCRLLCPIHAYNYARHYAGLLTDFDSYYSKRPTGQYHDIELLRTRSFLQRGARVDQRRRLRGLRWRLYGLQECHARDSELLLPEHSFNTVDGS